MRIHKRSYLHTLFALPTMLTITLALGGHLYAQVTGTDWIMFGGLLRQCKPGSIILVCRGQKRPGDPVDDRRYVHCLSHGPVLFAPAAGGRYWNRSGGGEARCDSQIRQRRVTTMGGL